MKHYYDEKVNDYVTYISDVIDVVAVSPLEDYLLQITFSDNAVKIYDVKPLLDKGVFKKLKNPFVFKKAYVDYGTVVWENGEIDIAPETLYDNGLE
ncbi:MAG: DUF2442 domain-containing protein [Fibromonadaceae bacterium]|jgi:hypothetical protein|nr:DUF2442 domain-containing protein [Fibromonadaceae bacterium]